MRGGGGRKKINTVSALIDALAEPYIRKIKRGLGVNDVRAERAAA